jgi:hypothetical protein
MLVERNIERSWVELTVTDPESIERDAKRPHVLRAFRRIPERGDRWLRVAYARAGSSVKIVTVFFDRGHRL